MKNKILLFLGFLIITLSVRAQNIPANYMAAPEDTISLYQQSADSLFQYLDKSPITTNVLYDRVAGFADLDTLSGLINSNTNPAVTTSSRHFMQAWRELYDASYSHATLMKPEWIDALIIQKRDSNIIPIGAINYRFNVLDSEAVQKNLIYLGADSLLHDVPGRSQAPYYAREIFLASPLLDKVQAGTVTFQFASLMLLQNNPVTITSLYIDFGGGQTATLLPGGTASVQLANEGTLTLSITANYSNSTQKIIRSTLEVEGSASGGSYKVGSYGMMGLGGAEISPCIPATTLTADIPFADYITSENKSGVIQVGYYYANCSSPQIHKPIIILDGFDPGDARKVENIYSLLNYNNGSNNFGEEMRQQGYDVIIVNFPEILEGYFNPFPGVQIPIYRDGGADYIERNALAVVKLIQSVNQQLVNNGSNEKLVIVGPSMGGLITRYALSYMEKSGLNHNTRLWVSFDSPHWGANIPIGDQYWLEYYARVAGKEGAKKSINNTIGSVAARQMLVHHWTAQSLTPAPNTFRNQFMQNLQANGLIGSNGFPQNLRKIALTNGAGNGSLQAEGTDCGEILHLKAKIRLWTFFVVPFLVGIKKHVVSESSIYFTSDYGNTCKIFDGWYKTSRWGSKHDRYEEKFAQTPYFTKSYDRVPGGTFDSQAQIKEDGEYSTWGGNLIHVQDFSNMINNHSFIPTVSALALTNSTSRDWSENLSTRNLVCTSETPFDNYLTPSANEEHVFLSVEKVAWLNEEIDKGQEGCPTICSFDITGHTGVLCINSNYTYNLDIPIPVGASTNWTTTSNLVIVSSTNNSITVKPVRSSSNYGSITANIFNPCGASTILTKSNLQISVTRITGTYNSPTHGNETMVPMGHWDLTTFNAACIAFETNISVPSGTTIQWLGPTGGDVYWSQSGNNVFCSFTEVGQTIVLSVLATNSCGTTSTGYRFKCTTTTSCGIQPLRVVISPNPAKTNMNVSLVQNHKTSVRQSFQKIRIINKMGSVKQNNQYNAGTKSVSVNISLLPPDVYTIQVFDGNTWYSEQFIKN